jgi:dienelactone hydrolase
MFWHPKEYRMTNHLTQLFCILTIGVAANFPIQAQTPGTMAAALRPLPPGSFDRQINPFQALKFASEAKTFSAFSNLSNAIFKPEGDGPFPAIVVTHSCGGVNAPQLKERMKELLDAGYLVLMLDSFTSRDQKDCRNGVVTGPLVWRDVVDALAHLNTLKDVDPKRIYQVGYSMGSQSAAALSSPSVNAYYKSAYRFRASVGWYGGCGYQMSPKTNVAHVLRADTDRPILLLLAEADRETPTRPFCFPLLEELKAAGQPVQWHIYESGTTHAWDSRSGYSFTNGWGELIVNRFDPQATQDASRRTIEFLKSNQ